MADKRRRDAMRASGLLNEDHSKIANLPQDVKYHAWPKAYRGLNVDLDDTIAGIDRQMSNDESQAHRYLRPKKY